jgi:hypothetical protein
MDLDDFLATTDANNQKQFYDQDITIATSTSVVVSQPVPHTIGDYPDARAWVIPSLIGGCWKPLTDLQVNDSTIGTFETIRGQLSATPTNVTVSLRPTSVSVDVTVRVRIYYND